MKNVLTCLRGLLFLSILFFCLSMSPVVHAEGTISNVGATVGSNAGPDAVSWPNAFSIMVDSYGHYVVPTQNASGNYYFTYSNDKGGTWASVAETSLQHRPTAVYDSRNDKIHVLNEERMLPADEEGQEQPDAPEPEAETGKDVRIEIKDKEGNPVKNTEVVLYSDPKKSTTDDRGIAQFHNIEPGVHTLVVNSADASGSQQIKVDDDPAIKEVHVSVVMTPKKSVPQTWFWTVVAVSAVVILYLLKRKPSKKR